MRGVFLLCAAQLASACAGCNDPIYLTEYRSLATSDATDGGTGTIAGDTDTFMIPIRRPNIDERNALAAEQMQKSLMMPVPWVGVRDLPVEIQYTLKNLDAQPGKVFFMLTGGNEFGAYNQAAYVNPLDPNAVTPPPLAGASPVDLAAGATYSGTFREDDIAEAAIDLEAIVRYPGAADMSIPFKVLNNRSNVSNVGLEMIPPNDVTPQQIGFIFTLNADVHVQADYVIRVRNLNNRLAPPGSKALYP
jgi:hypothetical protein